MSVKRISIGSGTTVCYADDGQAVAYEDYAALEKLCKQQHEALDRMDTEMIYIHEIAADDRSYSPEKKHLFASDEGRACLAQSKEALAAYAALFPKTGGAK